MNANSNIVKLNIGGTVFQTTKTTLTRFDGFFKTIMRTGVPVARDDSGVIFIDRSPKHFEKILNFMRDGRVELPESPEFVKEIRNEAEYYLLEGLVELCETKNRQAKVNKCRYLDNEEDIVNAYISSTKKGVIVIYYPRNSISQFTSEIASIGEKYSDELDVYFSKSEVQKRFIHFCEVRRKSDGRQESIDSAQLDSSIKRLFPNEN